MSTQTLRNPVTLSVSEREHQILNQLSKGKLAKEIAIPFQVTSRSIEKYIERLKERFDCKNTTELVAFAIRNQIIP